MRKIITVITLLIFSCRLIAQDLNLEKEFYSIPIGKNDNNQIQHIFDITQDSLGFIYLASSKGVFKYNGKKIEQLNQNINQYFGGSDLRFHANGKLFYQNFDGNVFTYSEKENWKIINKQKPVHYLLYGLFKNHFLFVHQKGVAVYDIKTNKELKTIPFSFKYPRDAAQDNEHYYLLTESMVAKFNHEKLCASYSIPKTNNNTVINQIYTYEDKIFIFPRSEFENGVIVLNKDLTYLYTLKIPDLKTGIINKVKFIDNTAFILTTGGIKKYSIQNNKWHFVETYFKDLNILDLYQGKNKEIWVSILGKGLFLIPNLNQFIYKLPNEKFTQIIPTKNGYLAGTVSGKIITLNNNFTTSKILAKSTYNSPITYLFQEKNNLDIFYVSGVGFNYINKKAEKYFYDNALKSVCYIDSVYYGLATSTDVLLYKSDNSKSYSYWENIFNIKTNNNNWAPLVSGKRTKSIIYDKINKRLIFLTNVGLFAIDQNGIEKEILNNQKSIMAEKMQYANGIVYLLKYNNELLKYENDNFHKINIERNSVVDIKSVNNNLIIKTNEGFQIIDVVKNNLKKLTPNIHLNTINDVTFKNENTLLATTDDGLLEISNKDKPKIVNNNAFIIDKIFVNGEEQKVFSKKSFNFKENNIEIQFAFLDFSVANKPQIFYRINYGNWQKIADNGSTLQFHNLAPGNYNIDFKLEDKIIYNKLEFSITPPFWKTWIFFLIISGLIVISITTFNYIKKARLSKYIKLLEEKIHLEKELRKSLLTSIKAQMNPHFFFNALNSIQAFIYKNDTKQAISYLGKFSKLTRLILSHTDSDYIILEDEINTLKLYLDIEAVRFNHKYEYEIKIDSALEIHKIKIPPMLIQPYLENCIKHGFVELNNNGKILIEIIKAENGVKISITDNGIGRVAANLLNNYKKESFSSQANERRLQILNQTKEANVCVMYTDLYTENNTPAGTKVELFIANQITNED